jgi:hypothetical protein
MCPHWKTIIHHTGKRSYTTPDIISRYRFDLLQIINFRNKDSSNQHKIFKDDMKIIGNYACR